LNQPYKVQLENFEGPLDLLLYFIRRDEIDIYDIPIARITEEYLGALDMMHQLNISVAGEFIVMAAHLMRIKAKMLLPRQSFEDEEFEDPRHNLVEKLLEYQQFKDAATVLDSILNERSQYFPKGFSMPPPKGSEDPGVYLKDVGLYDIARYFKDVMEKMPVIHDYELHREPVSLDKQKQLILSGFDEQGRLSFSSLVGNLKSKLEIIVTFLAILELTRLFQIKVVQSSIFGELDIVHIQHKA